MSKLISTEGIPNEIEQLLADWAIDIADYDEFRLQIDTDLRALEELIARLNFQLPAYNFQLYTEDQVQFWISYIPVPGFLSKLKLYLSSINAKIIAYDNAADEQWFSIDPASLAATDKSLDMLIVELNQHFHPAVQFVNKTEKIYWLTDVD